MGATHFLMKRLPNVATEMALNVLSYNLTRVLNIVGVKPLLAAMREVASRRKTAKIAALVSVTVGRERFRNAEPRFHTAWTLSGRRCCARLSGKRVLFGRYCPEGQLLAGRKSDPILLEKPLPANN
jgi:hypothetical protein